MNTIRLDGYNKGEVCKVGDLFLINGRAYVLGVQTDARLFFLSLKTGRMYGEPRGVKPSYLNTDGLPHYPLGDVMCELTEFEEDAHVEYLGECKITVERS